TLHASKHRMMTSIEEVNLRISYQAQVCRKESKYFYTQLHDAQTDSRDIRLEINVGQSAEDLAVTQMMRIHALETRAQTDTVEDAGSSYSHVTLTPVHPDGLQESSSVSSFVTSMLNPTSDAGVESIFTTASSPIVSLQTLTPIMTPSTIATITTSSDAPIPPTTILSIILENLLTFNSAFRFEERLRSLETTFSEYRQTNLFVDAVSVILGIAHQYMTQQMTKAIREAV
nr:hypothetical protein [Tanacetum cinerariifolium]